MRTRRPKDCSTMAHKTLTETKFIEHYTSSRTCWRKSYKTVVDTVSEPGCGLLLLKCTAVKATGGSPMAFEAATELIGAYGWRLATLPGGSRSAKGLLGSPGRRQLCDLFAGHRWQVLQVGGRLLLPLALGFLGFIMALGGNALRPSGWKHGSAQSPSTGLINYNFPGLFHGKTSFHNCNSLPTYHYFNFSVTFLQRSALTDQSFSPPPNSSHFLALFNGAHNLTSARMQRPSITHTKKVTQLQAQVLSCSTHTAWRLRFRPYNHNLFTWCHTHSRNCTGGG